jgi:hypothetical protein
MTQNNYPKLHNAMWPGLVGKGSPGAEPFIDFDTMLNLTAAAEVNGVKFDGVDLFLSDPHTSIDSSDDDIKRLADKVSSKNLSIGSVVAPVWGGTGGGSAMGSAEDRKKFVTQVDKACRIVSKLNDLGVRHSGVVRIDSSAPVTEWSKDPKGNTKLIAATFKEAAKAAKNHGERLAAEGEICWGGMHSWKYMIQLLEMVGQPKVVGFQADMAHTLLYVLGENAPEHRVVPKAFHWEPGAFHVAMKKLTDALRPWTMDFHVAQNDATVFGSGTHDHTGRHCLVTDPRGKLNVPRDAGYWLRDGAGKVTKKTKHICWDGCMFPNATLMAPQTWNDILSSMIQVRENHGWYEKTK